MMVFSKHRFATCLLAQNSEIINIGGNWYICFASAIRIFYLPFLVVFFWVGGFQSGFLNQPLGKKFQ